MTDKDPHYLSYWEVRDAIKDAAQKEDLPRLNLLKKLYPDIFKNMIGQATNASKRREEG